MTDIEVITVGKKEQRSAGLAEGITVRQISLHSSERTDRATGGMKIDQLAIERKGGLGVTKAEGHIIIMKNNITQRNCVLNMRIEGRPKPS